MHLPRDLPRTCEPLSEQRLDRSLVPSIQAIYRLLEAQIDLGLRKNVAHAIDHQRKIPKQTHRTAAATIDSGC
jgi:hypothetical protein